jgi:hypothetical protein
MFNFCVQCDSCRHVCCDEGFFLIGVMMIVVIVVVMVV